MIVLLPLLFFALASGESQFLNPPNAGPPEEFSQNPIWVLGSIQEIQWQTSLEQYSIALWRQSLREASADVGQTVFSTAPNANGAGNGKFNWTVQTYDFDLADSNVFFLGVNFADAVDGSDSFNSHYFNITRDTIVPSSSSTSARSTRTNTESRSTSSSATRTSSTPTLTVEPVTITTTESATLAAASASSSPTVTAEKSTKGNTIGLGVGLGVGISALAISGILFGLWYRRRMRRRKSEQAVVAAQASPPHELPLNRPREMVGPERYAKPELVSNEPVEMQ